MKKLMLLILIGSLAACSAPSVKVSTPRTVMLTNVNQDNAVEALKMAEEECLKNGRHAVAVPSKFEDQQSYECKE